MVSRSPCALPAVCGAIPRRRRGWAHGRFFTPARAPLTKDVCIRPGQIDGLIRMTS